MKETTNMVGRAVAAVLAAAGVLLLAVFFRSSLSGSSVGQISGVAGGNAAESFEMQLNNRLSGMLTGLTPQITVVKKSYRLNDGDLVAPAPDEGAFGETEDFSQILRVTEEAQTLLDGQSTFLTAETQRKPGTTVHYYRDDTILALSWKQVVGESVYTFAEVKLADASQFRRFFSDGRYNSGVLHTTTEMSASVNAVVASSGDYYGYRSFGIVVNEGKVYRDRGELLDTCYIDENGDMLFSYARQMTGDAVQQFVDENHVRFSLCFGPVMVRDGEYCVPDTYNSGEIGSPYPRSALCQLGKLHYLVVTANTEEGFYHLPTVGEFGKNLQAMGVPTAYALDGGQTAAIAMNHQLMNTVSYGSQREISDIFYFATAIPNGDSKTGEAGE